MKTCREQEPGTADFGGETAQGQERRFGTELSAADFGEVGDADGAESLAFGVHSYTESESYVPPENEEVREALRTFSDLKLGFMMHFSPATLWGCVESWALSSGEAAWSRRDVNFCPPVEFAERYFALNRRFSPDKFSADRIARLAESCGFRYLLFTTKHHDGFCMYDSAFSDYKITAEDCPFHRHPQADVCRALFDAFRARGMKISAYYSKADWHHPDYWDPQRGEAESRNPNYDVLAEPEKWRRFVDFTHRQFEELIRDYGPIDCLWLDAGWVNAKNRGQDLRLDEIIPALRARYNPKLLVADRCCGGAYENILTPEQAIPDHPISVPWESCLTLGENFSYSFNENYKSARELIHSLIEILSKGGSLALNVTPQPDGELPKRAVTLLRRFGRFVRKHAEGIYGTTVADIANQQDWRFVAKEGKVYAYFLYRRDPYMPDRLFLPVDPAQKIERVRFLRTGQTLRFCRRNGESCALADAFAYEGKQIGLWLDCRELDMLEAEAADCFVTE